MSDRTCFDPDRTAVARRSTATSDRGARWFTVAMTVLLLGGCQSPAPEITPSFARFYLEASGAGVVTASLPQSGVTITVADKPVLTEYDFMNVRPDQTEFGRGLRFQLMPTAAHDFQRLADANRGQRVVLFVDGVPLGARRIAQAFDGSSLVILMEVSDDRLPRIAERVEWTSKGLQKPSRL